MSSPINSKARGVILRDNQILLIHRFNQGEEYWTIPGGSIEPGETPEQALKREIWEETGLELTHCSPLQLDSPGNHIFQCVVGAGIPKITAGPELDRQDANNTYDPEWVDITKLPNLHLHPNVGPQLHTILQKKAKTN